MINTLSQRVLFLITHMDGAPNRFETRGFANLLRIVRDKSHAKIGDRTEAIPFGWYVMSLVAKGLLNIGQARVPIVVD
jgi:hypothetical protein